MKVWISKYALTKGLFQVDVKLCDRGMVGYESPKWFYMEYAHGEGREWHRTRDEAVKRAEDMRKAKIASHYKAIAKLESKVF